jgi:hypothetical protein
MEMSTDAAFHELFVGGVTSLASGVAVVTARRTSGNPYGLAATAITSYTAHPPSLLVSIAHVSRCHDALASSERFGVHLLRSDELALAHGSPIARPRTSSTGSNGPGTATCPSWAARSRTYAAAAPPISRVTTTRS